MYKVKTTSYRTVGLELSAAIVTYTIQEDTILLFQLLIHESSTTLQLEQ